MTGTVRVISPVKMVSVVKDGRAYTSLGWS